MPSMQLNVSDFLPFLYIIAPLLVNKGMEVLRSFDLESQLCGHHQLFSQAPIVRI